mgnify:CR=1 FL=1
MYLSKVELRTKKFDKKMKQRKYTLTLIIHKRHVETVQSELLSLMGNTSVGEIGVEPYYKIKNRIKMTIAFTAEWNLLFKILSRLFYTWQSTFDDNLGIEEAISMDNSAKLKGLEWANLMAEETP